MGNLGQGRVAVLRKDEGRTWKNAQVRQAVADLATLLDTPR